MSDTMNTMELKKVDVLPVETLEIGDIINCYGDGIVTITAIVDSADGETYFIDGFNQHEDFVETVWAYGSMVDFYYPVEDEDE